MVTAESWQDVKNRFSAVAHDGGHDLAVSGSDVLGGTAAARHRFTLVATGASRLLGAGGDSGYEKWLTTLREKLRHLKPAYFSVDTLTSWRPKSRTLPISKIDLPAGGTRQASDDTGATCIDPAALVAATKRAGTSMVVTPDGNRFIVRRADRDIYTAYVALKRTRVPCLVYEQATSGTSGTAQPVETVTEHEAIHPVCLASIELCDLLADEVFASESPAQGKPRDRQSTARRAARTRETRARHQRWRKAHRDLQKSRPHMSKVWYARQIARQMIAEGRADATIRKHLIT